MSLPYTISRRQGAGPANGNLWVYFLVIQFPDGTRSVPALMRTTAVPAGAKGWHPILTGAGTKGAAYLDARLAAGDVLFILHDTAQQALWTHEAQYVGATGVNAFAWGMGQLAQTASQSGVLVTPPASVVVSPSTGKPIVGSPSMPVAVPAPAPAPKKRWPWVVGLAAAAGAAYYFLE